MKKTIILILIVFISLPGYTQLLNREEDLTEKGFSTKDFLSLDSDFAIELAEQKAKTMIKSLVNQAKAAAPFVGTSGVAAELGLTNLKFDEMIVADKNYNYKLTSLLGNMLKVTKEARDGTFKSRGLNAARKIEIVDESMKAIKKCKKTKEALLALRQKGWNTTTMTRAVKALDASLNTLETVGETLLSAYNSYEAEKEAIDKTKQKLEDVNAMMNSMYSQAMSEVNNKLADRYNFEYSSSLLTGAIYCQDLTKEEAREKVTTNLKRSHNSLIVLKNIMWSICFLFFLVMSVGAIWKVFLAGDETHMLIKYNTSWLIAFSVTLIVGGVLEKFISTIYR